MEELQSPEASFAADGTEQPFDTVAAPQDTELVDNGGNYVYWRTALALGMLIATGTGMILAHSNAERDAIRRQQQEAASRKAAEAQVHRQREERRRAMQLLRDQQQRNAQRHNR